MSNRTADTESNESIAAKKSELWLDTFAQRLGFGRLAQRVPGNLAPSYLYAIITIVLSYVFTIVYNVANNIPLVYNENPYFILQPFLLLGAVYSAHSLQIAYDGVMEEMRIAERTSEPESLLDPVPSWLPWTIFAIGAVLQLGRAVFLDISTWGLTDFLANLFLFPFVFLPIVVQFFIMYIKVEFLAPWRLSRSDIGVHFLDPQGLGGLRPLGELIKRAYYYVVAGLIGFAFITYAPFVDSTWTATAADSAIFSTIWIVSVGTVAFAVFTLHRFMHREKRREIYQLEAQLRDLIENPWDVQSYDIPENKQSEVEQLRERIDRVNATKEYPATFSIWSQLLVSVALPKAVQLFLAGG